MFAVGPGMALTQILQKDAVFSKCPRQRQCRSKISAKQEHTYSEGTEFCLNQTVCHKAGCGTQAARGEGGAATDMR